jgi:hypothetical protein
MQPRDTGPHGGRYADRRNPYGNAVLSVQPSASCPAHDELRCRRGKLLKRNFKETQLAETPYVWAGVGNEHGFSSEGETTRPPDNPAFGLIRGLRRYDSKSPTFGEPNVFDFEILSARLVYAEMTFVGKNAPYYR